MLYKYLIVLVLDLWLTLFSFCKCTGCVIHSATNSAILFRWSRGCDNMPGKLQSTSKGVEQKDGKIVHFASPAKHCCLKMHFSNLLHFVMFFFFYWHKPDNSFNLDSDQLSALCRVDRANYSSRLRLWIWPFSPGVSDSFSLRATSGLSSNCKTVSM